MLASTHAVKDLDDFWNAYEPVIQRTHHRTGYLYASSLKEIKELSARFMKDLRGWIEEQKVGGKQILLVGLSYLIHARTGKYYFMPIDADRKYVIDISVDVLLRQFIKRDIINICTDPVRAVAEAVEGRYNEMWKKDVQKRIKDKVDRYYGKLGYKKEAVGKIAERLVG